ncbi:MAG TPA: class I SAM-dependent methyltransferase [Anaerolineales bacterium]|nr:class I SAM-dependent methyltransferase [Anaerolineales bacterium]
MKPELYLRLREREGRLYSDDIVVSLPLIPAGHRFAAEWHARARSAARLTRYLSARPRPLSILELGCANGWLSNLLSKAGHSVLGMDQNRHELKQAARVFRERSHLSFLEADIFSAPFISARFDVIILASVLQYFKDVRGLVSALSIYLKPNGEIHIMDTPLYLDNELDAAILRSRQYYTALGFPEMRDHYFHHRVSDMQALHPKLLYQPQSWTLRLKRLAGQTDSPFPWFMIRK